MARIEMLGRRFGRLVVIEYSGRDKRGECMWICKCDCGSVTHPIKGSVLRTLRSQSCGCLQRELQSQRNGTHHKSKTRLYNIWTLMKRRCHSPTSPAFDDYGGRGIEVCEEWMHDFQAFYDWAISHGYKPNLTIDRVDNSKGYCPENCRWATAVEQQENRRNTILVQIDGTAKTLTQLCKDTGIPYKTLHRWHSNNTIETKLSGR